VSSLKVTVNLQELKHVEAGVTYASVVPHASGVGKDSSHRTAAAKASDICLEGEGGGFVGTCFGASALEPGGRWGFVTFTDRRFGGSGSSGAEGDWRTTPAVVESSEGTTAAG